MSLIRLKLCEQVLNDDIKRKDRIRLRRGKRTTLTGHPSMHHAGAWSHRVPFTQDETGSKNITSTRESILKVRVKPRSLYRGLYFSKKPQTYFPAVTLRRQGKDSRLCRARRHFPGALDSREADRKAGLHKHSGASGLKIRAGCLKKQQPWALEGLGNSLLMQTHWLTS